MNNGAESDQEGWELSRAGWISDALIDERNDLQRRVDALRAQHDHLAAEIEAARALGREEGLRRGFAELKAVIAEVAQNGRQRQEALLDNTVTATIAAARALVAEAVEADRELVGRLVRQAIEMRPEHTPIRVRVHVNDLAAARASVERGNLPVEADPTLGAGDVVVEYGDGRVDCRLVTLLSGFSDDLRRELNDDRR